MRDALLANCAKKHLFRMSPPDSDLFDELADKPRHSITQIAELQRYQYRLDNEVHTVAPLPTPPCKGAKTVTASLRQYARPVALVDAELDRIFGHA